MEFSDLGITGYKAGAEKSYTTCPKCSSERKKKNVKCLTVSDVSGNRWFKCNHPGCKGNADGTPFRGNLDFFDKFDEVVKKARLPKTKQLIYSEEINEWCAKKGLYPMTLSMADVYEEKDKYGNGTILKYPMKMHGVVVDIKYRGVKRNPETGKYPHWFAEKKLGTKSIMWGLDDVDYENSNDLIICEGESDRLTLLQNGVLNVLSIPNGAPATNSVDFATKFDYLKDDYTTDIIRRAKRIILMGDNDEGGEVLNKYLKKFISEWMQVPAYVFYEVVFPNGYKDPNEVYNGDVGKKLKAKGANGIKILMNSARPIPIKGIITLGDIREDMQKIRTTGFERGLLTGHDFIDDYLSFKTKLLKVTSGRAKMGKTTFNRFQYIELARKNDIKFAIFTPEMRPAAREISKMVQVYANASIVDGDPKGMTPQMYEKALRWVMDHFIIINPTALNIESFGGVVGEKDGRKLSTILKYIEHLKKTHNIFGFQIDAYSNLETDEDVAKLSETKVIQKQLEYMHDFIDYNDLFLDMVVHPRKIKTLPSGNSAPVNVDDLDGSAHWENKSDIITIYERDKYVLTDKKDKEGNPIYARTDNLPARWHLKNLKQEELGKEGMSKVTMNEFGVFSKYESKDKKGKKSKPTVHTLELSELEKKPVDKEKQEEDLQDFNEELEKEVNKGIRINIDDDFDITPDDTDSDTPF